MLNPFNRTHPETCLHRLLPARRLQQHGNPIERRRARRPQFRRGDLKGIDFPGARPRCEFARCGVNHSPVGILHFNGQVQWLLQGGRVVEPTAHFHAGLAIRAERWLDVNTLQRNRRHINQCDMAVEPAIAVEIAQVRGNTLGIAGVVAQDGDRHGAGKIRVRTRPGGRLGDVHGPFVVPSEVFTDLLHPHKDLRPLSCTIEVKQRAAIRKWIRQPDPRAIPARALVVVHVWIHRIACVEAVRQCHRRPGDIVRRLVTAPDLPGAAQRALVRIPSRRRAVDAFRPPTRRAGQPTR